MNINLPKASVGLGTSGIGDNFARSRLLMAQKAGYVQSTPSPYSQPGTALKQYQSAAPLLNAVAKAQGQKGIPGLIRQGMLGRPPIKGLPGQDGSLGNTPAPTFQSTVAGHAVGNPFANLGQPNMPLNAFNKRPKPQPAPVRPGTNGPYVPGPEAGGQEEGSPGVIHVPGGGKLPAPPGGVVGPVSPGQQPNPGNGWGGVYPPGTQFNHGGIDPRVNLLSMLLGMR